MMNVFLKIPFEYGNRISSENLVIDNKHKLFFNKELPDVSKFLVGFQMFGAAHFLRGERKI